MNIGEILISEKYITSSQLEEALSIQQTELHLPLGQILVKMQYIKPDELQKVIKEIGVNQKIGELLISQTLITERQLQEALDFQKIDGRLLGEVLLYLNLISEEDLAKVLIMQSNIPRLGEWLVEKGLLTDTNLKLALKYQSRGRRIGDILVELGYLTRQSLNDVIRRHNKRESLESVLLKEGFLTRDQLEEANRSSLINKTGLKESLISCGFIDDEQLQQVQAIRYEIPYQQFSKIAYSPDQKNKLSSIFGATFARSNKMIPALLVNDNEVLVVILDAKSLSQIDDLKHMYGLYNFSPCFVSKSNFERIFSLVYGKDSTIEVKESSSLELIYEGGTEQQLKQLESLHQSEAVRLVNMIVEKAMLLKASDIHIESDVKGTLVRYRIEGVLRNLDDLELNNLIGKNILSIISRLKVMANLDLAERRLPQDGSFRMTYKDTETTESYPVDFRVATIKGNGLAENIAIRVLDSKHSQFTLEDLNYSMNDIVRIKRVLDSPSGLFLVTGPTGSGKTTLLYSCIHYLNEPGIKIMTSENPVEYIVPGITQVSINSRIGLTNAKVLRSFLRQDPDIIMVGEIRDIDTADVVITAAETGHLVLSTLHTSDPIEAILRLVDLKVGYESIVSVMLGIISQRLLKLNCSNCNKEYIPREEEWKPFFTKFPQNRRFYKGTGCNHCGYTGYKGRRPVYEVLIFDRHIQNLIRERADLAKIRETAIKNGFITMVESGLKNSDISLSELLKTQPYHLIEEFRNNEILLKRNNIST